MLWPQSVTRDMEALLAKSQEDRDATRARTVELLASGDISQEDADLVNEARDAAVVNLTRFVARLPRA